MLHCKKLGALLLVAALFAAAPCRRRSRPVRAKGDKFYSDGRKAEDKKDYDEALKLYEQALSEDPADTGYQLAVDRVLRFQAGQHHVEVGLKLRPQGKLAEKRWMSSRKASCARSRVEHRRTRRSGVRGP